LFFCEGGRVIEEEKTLKKATIKVISEAIKLACKPRNASAPFEELTSKELEEMVDWCQKHLRYLKWSDGDWAYHKTHKSRKDSIGVIFGPDEWGWYRFGSRDDGFSTGNMDKMVHLPLSHQWMEMKEFILSSWALKSSVSVDYPCWILWDISKPHTQDNQVIYHKNPHYCCFLGYKLLLERAK